MRRPIDLPALLSSRPRLWSSLLLGLLVYLTLPTSWVHHTGGRVLLAWNACAGLYLLLALHMVWQADAEQMQRRALKQNEGRWLVLGMVVLASVVVLVAVGSQLGAVKKLPINVKAPHVAHVALAALTVLSSWLFTQTVMAVHYAHDFYWARANGRADPLLFPGTTDPRYADFFYFSCVIGTSGQTADVSFTGSDMRPTGTLHCILAFFFNTTVLALTINIAAGLFDSTP
jgi:uncharacterized membrane protein